MRIIPRQQLKCIYTCLRYVDDKLSLTTLIWLASLERRMIRSKGCIGMTRGTAPVDKRKKNDKIP